MNWESCGDHGVFICVRETPGRQSKPCIIHGENLQHTHGEHTTTHLTIKAKQIANKRDVEVFIVCLSCHFDVGLFHVIGHGGTPLAVLDDTYILTMTRALLATLS